MSARPIRWSSDGDRYWGRFTYAREREGWRPFAIELGSGDGDEYSGCRLRLSAFGRTLIVALPAIIKPWRRWVDTSMYAWGSERGGYWETGAREYGFSLSEGGHVSVSLGRVTNDSSTEQRWGYFLPWMQDRHVRHSYYGLEGEHISDAPRWEPGALGRPDFAKRMEQEEAARDLAPTVVFAFSDFDGDPLTATTRIEEREWRRGTGWWKWMSLFWPKIVRRSLDIRFSGETGKRKGSWKGGTIGHSIDMLPGELHESAFRRYCAEHDMAFGGQVA